MTLIPFRGVTILRHPLCERGLHLRCPDTAKKLGRCVCECHRLGVTQETSLVTRAFARPPRKRGAKTPLAQALRDLAKCWWCDRTSAGLVREANTPDLPFTVCSRHYEDCVGLRNEGKFEIWGLPERRRTWMYLMRQENLATKNCPQGIPPGPAFAKLLEAKRRYQGAIKEVLAKELRDLSPAGRSLLEALGIDIPAEPPEGA